MAIARLQSEVAALGDELERQRVSVQAGTIRTSGGTIL